MTVGELLDAIEPILARTPELVHDERIDDRIEDAIGNARDDVRARARREARELVAALLDVAPVNVASSRNAPITPEQVDRAHSAALRRQRGEPLAYCVGTAAFRHLVLAVDRRVLIPRAETEIVVEEALKVARDGTGTGGIAVDIGTGSGAIALSLASEGNFDVVIATDISSDALDVARRNVRQLVPPHARVDFRLGVDFAPLEGIKARLIVSNPPYIAPAEAPSLPPSVRDWEPATALFADNNGMARYHELVAHAPEYLDEGGWLVLEVDSRRAGQTAALATASGRYASVRLVRDLSGRERVLLANVGRRGS